MRSGTPSLKNSLVNSRRRDGLMHRSKHNSYSITSSASKSIELGAVSLSAFAVLRLICSIQEQRLRALARTPTAVILERASGGRCQSGGGNSAGECDEL